MVVNASTSQGMDGCAGYRHFTLPNDYLTFLFAIHSPESQINFFEIPIPRPLNVHIELIANLVGSVFAEGQIKPYDHFYTDNTEGVSCLQTSGLDF